MRTADYAMLAFSSLRFSRLRTYLTALGIAVGIAAVVLLTALGGGAQDYMLGQFTQFGAHIIAVNPGKTTTMGVSGAVISNIRPLSLEDAEGLRRIPNVRSSVPVVQGNSPVEHGNRTRWTFVIGVNHEVPQTWKINVAQGRFLPNEKLEQARNLAVIGYKIKQELFPGRNPLGEFIRIGQERFRVIGVMESKGQVLGFDMDDIVYIPVYRAMSLYNRESLMEVDLLYAAGRDEKQIVERIKKYLIERHGGEDFTITSQTDILGTLGSILTILTAVVAGLGSISLLVGGVGIFTIMSIAVNERIKEIGLLRALGASKRQITLLFLFEAAVLSGLGGVAGMLTGLSIAWLMHFFIPALPVSVSWDYVLLAEIIAIATGMVAGLLPARKAASMAPVEALRSE
ncbi:MAG: putative ABC transporter protein [uncultured Thiotrichaceae bacterium]|uniref:Putative ABC transporter protein n=1 Tax=uncultured Thiotrichaceae bacterium TaxID=298394 RepID=A0A6S6T989_9GAMM|nr:MAG: putative ABC transporter protein [uncultured Thiotrichaceae bacterium]